MSLDEFNKWLTTRQFNLPIASVVKELSEQFKPEPWFNGREVTDRIFVNVVIQKDGLELKFKIKNKEWEELFEQGKDNELVPASRANDGEG